MIPRWNSAKLPQRRQQIVLRKNSLHDFTMYVCQTEIAALMSEREAFVVDSELLQNRRIEVMNVDGIFVDVVAEVVSLAVNRTTFYSGSGHPFGIAPRMMVSTVVGSGQSALAINCPSKFSAPDHQRIIQKTSLF